MAGGITCKSQPIDMFLGKCFKGNHREYYDMYILTALVNKKGQPIAPSRQLSATWTVKAWEKIPEELIRKVWQCCGYKNVEDIENVKGSANAVVKHLGRYDLMQVVEKAAEAIALEHFCDPENEFHESGDDEDAPEEQGTWEVSF